MPSELEHFLREQGSQAELLALPVEVSTVEAAAEAVGTTADKIVKSVLFMVDGQPVLAISSGARRIDRRRIAQRFAVGRKQVRLADEFQVQSASRLSCRLRAPVWPPRTVVDNHRPRGSRT